MKTFRLIPAITAACLLVFSGILVTVHMFSVRAQVALPGQFFAPFDDVTNGGPSLQSITQATGQKYFTLAFVGNGGNCTAEWAGTIPPNETSTYLPNLNSDIQYVRSQGGDVIISFGGEDGSELAQICTSASALQAQYQTVITQYKATHLDFDIEGGEEGDATTYTRRNTALAALQKANPGLSISFTLPSATTGLLNTSMGMLSNAISQGVNISIVNLMTMDYGSADSQMGQEAVNAGNGLYGELKSLYPSKSPSQLWSMVGITPMIGQNDSPGEIFSLQDAQALLSFAQQNHIGELSMWQMSRDNGSCAGSTVVTPKCSGLAQNTYDFAKLFQSFAGTGTPMTTTTPMTTGTPMTTTTPMTTGTPVTTATPVTTGTPMTTATPVTTGTPNPMPSGGNLLVNPGFEQGNLSGWQCDTNDAVVKSPVHSGTYALQVTPGHSTTGQCTQTINVLPNHLYTLSAYVQGNFAFLGTSSGVSNWTSSTTYTKLSIQFPTGPATSVTIYIHGWYIQGNVFADDFSLQ